MDVEDVKCVLIGDAETGKSCMSISLTTNSCPGDYIPTIYEYYTENMYIDGKQVRLHLMDTSGLGKKDIVRQLSYQKAKVLLICFSIINPQSFRNVYLKWLPEAKLFRPNAKIILVGTKVDMRSSEASAMTTSTEKPVTYNEGFALAKKINAFEYLECSALTQEGLREVFEAVAKAGLLPLGTVDDSDSEFESDDETGTPTFDE